MTAPHFFVDPSDVGAIAAGDRLALSESDSHHALRSLRLRPGEEVTVANDLGWVGRGTLAGEREGRAVIDIREAVDVGIVRHPTVVVTLAPPKGDRLGWAVQKLAELGVDEIDLLESERTVRYPGPKVVARLKTVAREAAMQSRQPRIARIGAWDGLHEALVPRDGFVLMLHGEASRRVADALPPDVARVHVLVGPEGGWSTEEIRLAEDAGAVAASLGPAILRTETAAVVGAALVLARYGRLG